MKVKFEYGLDKKAKEKTSGLEGIIDMLGIRTNGNIVYSIQPQAINNKREDGWWIDEDSIELLDESSDQPLEVEFKFSTLDRVIDIVSDFEGAISMAVIYLNGCKKYLVKGKFNKKKGIVPEFWIGEECLELVSKNKRKKNKGKKAPGGPSERNDSY